jgi:hypothetical protein
MDSLEFALVAKVLVVEARRRGLTVPGFRCPPRIVGVDRSLRRVGDHVTVAVRVKGRPLVAVIADMIEGVVVANRLVPPAADRLRRELWLAVSSAKLDFVPPSVHDFTVVSDRGNAA